jgi:hypothetical protein
MSDRELVERRSDDELRRLKKHVSQIREDPKVAALAAAHDSAASRFTLEAFQNGVVVAGHACRLTIGTLALLRATSSRCLGFGKDESALTDHDIEQAVFLMAEDARNVAVSVADDAAELRKSVRKFGRALNTPLAAVELLEMLRRNGVALRPGNTASAAPGEDESVFHAPDDAWSDDVDLLAHEYGWRDDYILWEIPLVRVARLRESIVARRTGKSRTSSRDASGIAFLQAVEEASEKLLEEQGGTE